MDSLRISVVENVINCVISLLLQVLYYCPGFREGIKKLYSLSKRKEKPQEETNEKEEVGPKQIM